MTGHMRVGFHAPDTVEELAYLVAEAADTRTPLEVMGRGTKREIGRPVQHGAVLSTERLVGVPLYEPSELTLVALAGTPIGQIERLLADNDQEFPFEPVELQRRHLGQRLEERIVHLRGEPGACPRQVCRRESGDGDCIRHPRA